MIIKCLVMLNLIIFVKFVFFRLGLFCNVLESRVFILVICDVIYIRNDKVFYFLDFRMLFD